MNGDLIPISDEKAKAVSDPHALLNPGFGLKFPPAGLRRHPHPTLPHQGGGLMRVLLLHVPPP